jgi:hypothetical protein
MREFVMAIAIKEKARGNNYSKPILETGYMDVNNAVDEANRVMQDKFGVKEQLELTRGHRKRRRE